MPDLAKPKDQPPPPLVCEPPLTKICNAYGGCSCVGIVTAPPNTPSCTVSIVYREQLPNQAYIAASTCDSGVVNQASLELAIAVILAKLMGAPTLP